jgi:hypothetical protein
MTDSLGLRLANLSRPHLIASLDVRKPVLRIDLDARDRW